MEHCVINGERCTKCCQVLSLQRTKNLFDWISYAKSSDDSNCDSFAEKENYQIGSMITQISKRRAKKINPYMVKLFGRNKKSAFFTCKNLTKDGCGIYETRPKVCSGYPYYGRDKAEFAKMKPDYSEDCTYFVELR